MKRNPLRNSTVLLLALALAVAATAGCKKKEEPKQLTPMPHRPPQASAPRSPQPAVPPVTAPQTAPGAAPGAASAPSAATTPAPAALQGQASSAVRHPVAGTQLSFKNRVDPFKPFMVEPPPQAKVEQATPQTAPRREGDLLPIQSYDVSKFRVVGIIAGLRENKALVVDPAGKGYVVQVGMPLGSNEGRITRISASGVEVVESFKEGRGHVKKRKIVLTLAKKR
ncbi:pilus assembly protein PilP [Geomesophilobacter sediminis]|uniref:Pilus assembly protein PilP n=1 Tax=Geomesophilobacter sediminis TaxID=2798584 RepID=A0A8J7SAF4_9BACT|nr:pilus assembly protein PilP [Geomesophilobacter sediminis]MBJ6727450.1 pilus assembly protein PilP [Geomesophilobacter sediminis]